VRLAVSVCSCRWPLLRPGFHNAGPSSASRTCLPTASRPPLAWTGPGTVTLEFALASEKDRLVQGQNFPGLWSVCGGAPPQNVT